MLEARVNDFGGEEALKSSSSRSCSRAAILTRFAAGFLDREPSRLRPFSVAVFLSSDGGAGDVIGERGGPFWNPAEAF